MRVYVKIPDTRKNPNRGITVQPQGNTKARLIKRDSLPEKSASVTPDVESNVSHVIELITADHKQLKARKRKARKTWDTLFTKGK